MSTLADELLNDFEDSGSEGEEEQKNGFMQDGAPPASNDVKSATFGVAMELDEEVGDEDMADEEAIKLGDEETAEEAKAKVEKMDLGGVDDVRSVARLMEKLEPVLKQIAHYQSLPPEKQTTHVGSVEDNPEYHLLTQSNTLSTSIDNEIILVHKFIRDHYSIRFPELETLITGPLDYAKAVAAIGNGPMDKVKGLLEKLENTNGKRVLDGPTVMVVNLEATTTRGRELSAKQLQTVLRACDMTVSLDSAKNVLTGYVQSRMNIFAPNLTALIGSLTAAQLLNVAGGLSGLAAKPACNLAPLGAKKQTQTGFATNVGAGQQGFLFHSPLIQSIPNDLKRQAIRIVSAKVVLACRVDRVHSSPDGREGEQLRQNCLDRLEKLTEPPPNKGPKAVPAPDDKLSRKRGGRRARKAKEATAMTDLRKAQNRMVFGKEEKEVGFGDDVAGLGMIGQANDGRIRSMQIDQRTKAKLSKNNKGWGGTSSSLGGGTASSLRGFGQGAGMGNASVLKAHGLRGHGVGGGEGTAGTASTVAFTPVQGLELVDPSAQREMKRKRDAEDDRWFKGGTFTQVGGAPAGAAAPGTGGAGFKVPALPAKAKANGTMGPPPAKKVA